MRTLTLLALSLGLVACAATEGPSPSSAPAAAQPSPYPGLDDAAWSTVRTMDGRELDLAAAARGGRAVALVFWLPWCASCLEEGPAVAAAAERLASELLVVGVVTGPDEDVDEGEVRKVVERLGLDYPHVRDRDLAMAEDLRVLGTPTIVVYGPDGRYVKRATRVHDWDALVAEL